VDGLRDRDRFVAAVADVRDRTAVRDVVEWWVEEIGPPAVLVNNAGIDSPPSVAGDSWLFGDIPDEVSAQVLDVNALGALRMCQAVGPRMAAGKRGSIINIGSLYGALAPDPRLYEHLPVDPPFLKPPAYGMSKAGLASLTRYLAALGGACGVRVNTLSPGGGPGDRAAGFGRAYSGGVPLRRMAPPGALTGPLLFLASDASRYVTGTELVVDGGYGCW